MFDVFPFSRFFFFSLTYFFMVSNLVPLFHFFFSYQVSVAYLLLFFPPPPYSARGPRGFFDPPLFHLTLPFFQKHNPEIESRFFPFIVRFFFLPPVVVFRDGSPSRNPPTWQGYPSLFNDPRLFFAFSGFLFFHFPP